MKVSMHCFQQLAVVTFTTIAFYANSVSAQIVPDATLPNNSRVTPQNKIEGGTKAGNNLFHSFEQFSVPTGITAHFNNPANIQNIITRITGKSISNIDGTLRANGTANLFLINPNGIVFGENASLNIGGSFLATTASSINFPDGTKFSAIQPKATPLLSINVPIGLQFGATAAPIRNQSQASSGGATNISNLPVGLQVPTGKTLALIGGDVTLEGGNLTVDSGRIELGSVAGNSFVSLNSIDQNWELGYENVENFQNIQLIERKIDDSTIGSIVDVSGKNGGGSIRVQGNSVELIGYIVLLSTITTGNTDGGDLTINARKLVVQDGSQIVTSSEDKGAAGNLTVNASDSVELIGTFIDQDGFEFPSALFSGTDGDGDGGNLNINTKKLLVHDGAGVSVETGGILKDKQLILATGKGGNLTINASEIVELSGRSAADSSSFLRSTTLNSTDAENLTISTKRLIVRDGAEINISSLFPLVPPNTDVIGDTSDLGNAGNLNITADFILLDNAALTSQTDSGNGGDINLQLQDLLLMRRNSQISTDGGTAELAGDGGNIAINIPDGFILAIPNENNDITANAFTGSGGRVDINAAGIFGIKPLSGDELAELEPNELNPQNIPSNDITAISQENPTLNGEVDVDAPDLEPTQELVELPEIPIDTKISQVCKPGKNANQREFIFTRRGGLPPIPGEALRTDSPLGVDWVSVGGNKGRKGRIENISIGNAQLTKFKVQNQRIQNQRNQNQIVEATGWIVDKNGDIVLVAGTPNIKGDNSKGVGC